MIFEAESSQRGTMNDSVTLPVFVCRLRATFRATEDAASTERGSLFFRVRRIFRGLTFDVGWTCGPNTENDSVRKHPC